MTGPEHTDEATDVGEPVDGVIDVDSAAADDAAAASNDEGGHLGANDPMYGFGSAEEALTDAVTSLELVTAQRDEYRDLAQRVQADFENYKRRIEGQRVEQAQRAAEALVVELLPVLDACEAALSHGHDDVAPIQASLLTILEKRGLAIVEADAGFDPELHDAVLREEGEGNGEGPVVTEVMRTGYAWNGRVVRPAMVKVRG